jgi:hypothetical protein
MYIHAVHADLAGISLTVAPSTRVSSAATRTVPAVGVWFDTISSECDMIYAYCDEGPWVLLVYGEVRITKAFRMLTVDLLAIYVFVPDEDSMEEDRGRSMYRYMAVGWEEK